VFGEDQYVFRRESRTAGAVGVLTIICAPTFGIDELMCASFTDRQKASDRVNRTELMQILMKLILTGAKGD
jgi:hypothetical protein